MTNWKDKVLKIAASVEHKIDGKKFGIKKKYKLLEPLRIQAYRGYGSKSKIYISGRLLEKSGTKHPSAEDSIFTNMATLFKRYASDEVPNAKLKVDILNSTFAPKTDAEGYYHIDATIAVTSDNHWLDYSIELIDDIGHSNETVKSTGHVIMENAGAARGVISDLDDTVVISKATNFLEKIKILLVNNEHTRQPFAGVAEFYRALAGQNWAQPANPFFYVSSSSWNMYDMFYNFCKINKLPQGCFLLRDVGLSENKLYRSSHGDHKVDNITKVLNTFSKTTFILVGDSGQHDPEIYYKIAQAYASQIDVIYIRDVEPSKDNKRDAEVLQICQKTKALGVPMVLVKNSLEAAQDALDRGFIEPSALKKIEEVVLREEAFAQNEHDTILEFLGLQ